MGVSFRRLVLVPPLLAAAGCGTFSDGSTWASRATPLPPLRRVERAFVDAATDPWTWVPLAGAAVLSVDDWDERVTHWAGRETPLFGSTDRADDVSDRLRRATATAWMFSTVLPPGGPDADTWALDRAEGIAIQWGAREISGLATDGLKSLTSRRRPDRSDDHSFPSQHTSGAFADAALVRRNLDMAPLAQPARVGADLIVSSTAVATGWARVEAQRHHPTDVLAGAALGNFVARFLNGAFLEGDGPIRIDADIDAGGRTCRIGVTFEW